MGDRGRKSRAELASENGHAVQAQEAPPAPSELNPEAQRLWEEIIASRPPDFYGPGDLPLLEHYCYLTKKLVPDIKELISRDLLPKHMDMLNKVILRAESLAKDLRICVSSRTRPDSKKVEDSMSGELPWVE